VPTEAPLFEIDDLHVKVAGGLPILNGVDLTVQPGEVHALMGPNGSGKSTLASALLAAPEYEITQGRLRFNGDDITDWPTDVRGKAGLFLAFQYPQAIAGVSVLNFLRQALSARKGIDLSVLELRLAIMEWMERLEMDPSFLDRYLTPIDGPVMITAANTIKGAAMIAQAKPHLAPQIAAAILRVEKARYATPECRNVAIGHGLEALRGMGVAEARELAKRHLRNPRVATARKAAGIWKRRTDDKRRSSVLQR